MVVRSELTESELSKSDAIRLTIQSTISEFDGFLDFGQPIMGLGTDARGKEVPLVLNENRAQSPVFTTHSLSTDIELQTECTAIISGPTYQTVSQIEEGGFRLPFGGDKRFGSKEVTIETTYKLYHCVSVEKSDGEAKP